MKVAQIAPLYESVPPSLYGGTERVVAHLTQALVEQGHEVTLFAAGGSSTSATLVECRHQALRLDESALKSDLASHMSMLHELRNRASEFDILHFHTDLLHFPFFEAIAHRTLTTVHGRLDIGDLPETYARWPDYPLVSISQHQRGPLSQAHWIANIPHGLPDVETDFKSGHGDYLVFLGRISPEKRPDRAIAIARAAGLPLKIAAKVDWADRNYFDAVVRPQLGVPGVEFLGEIDDRAKSELMGHARALLFPIDWPEPFGLVMIEAMACGTPVIGWRCGSVPEVLDHGVTGLMVSSEEEAVKAVRQVLELDRQTIRDVFKKKFSATVMAQRYVGLYRHLLRGHDITGS
ncbi:Glycosyltransferase involved in cell wall bisynthesis [Pseudomonas asturiensis]|uniref:Glycosyltransferase involved in cell wall bisynthesis n=1 Tax=Pseudomonas asturiensis TaxID=1190415 RepID=A0A1M7KR48_9PSED|nr:glycosyltransferase family 4 protein [Pseudomonas asturiensis]SHM67916.1 Glycosyltransferase involved in cell wall bisynthesis [Pseudomonas asturiensis]